MMAEANLTGKRDAFLVTKGKYADEHHVVAVFLEQERAYEYARLIGGEVETCPFDPESHSFTREIG